MTFVRRQHRHLSTPHISSHDRLKVGATKRTQTKTRAIICDALPCTALTPEKHFHTREIEYMKPTSNRLTGMAADPHKPIVTPKTKKASPVNLWLLVITAILMLFPPVYLGLANGDMRLAMIYIFGSCIFSVASLFFISHRDGSLHASEDDEA
ncbi:hypothetical protein [Rhodococcus koreensis]